MFQSFVLLNGNLNHYKLYKYLGDIGLTTDATINQIILAMGMPTILNLAVWKPSYTIFPAEASAKGHLQIINPGNQNRYAKVTYEDVTNGTQWIMKMTDDDNAPASGEWIKQATKSDLTSYLPLAGGTMIGTLIINGGTGASGIRICRTLNNIDYQFRQIISSGKASAFEMWENETIIATLFFDSTGVYYKTGNSAQKLTSNADLSDIGNEILVDSPNLTLTADYQTFNYDISVHRNEYRAFKFVLFSTTNNMSIPIVILRSDISNVLHRYIVSNYQNNIGIFSIIPNTRKVSCTINNLELITIYGIK